MAARDLKLDLDHADVDLPRGKIVLHGAHGVERTIPVDAKGYFYIHWQLTATNASIVRAPIEDVLKQDKLRLLGQTNGLRDEFRDRLVVVGSAAQGNDLTDHGATPLEKDTLLVSKYWNVASSVITGQFIRRASLPTEMALIIFLGVLTAFLTWQIAGLCGFGGGSAVAAGLCCRRIFYFRGISLLAPVGVPRCGRDAVRALEPRHVSRGF